MTGPKRSFSDPLAAAARLSVAPMMAWTDRHCRMFHRQISARALLYTEMVTAAAVVHGDLDRLLGHSAAEHPLALQLGGSDPDLLQQATKIAVDQGFAEVNLNCGCPSDRVQSGAFGAVLMKTPDLVARCVDAMGQVDGAVITVKCRIGVDDQTPQDILPDFLAQIEAAGVSRVTIHGRMAWLQGLSPKENRDIPPLDYALVTAMARAFPALHVSLNGGVASLDAALAHLDGPCSGVMIGRAAYHDPYGILARVDSDVYGSTAPQVDRITVAQSMVDYIAAHIAGGGRLHHVTRHMLGLFAGQPGARHWRRSLSELGAQDDATVRDYETLVAQMHDIAAPVAESA